MYKIKSILFAFSSILASVLQANSVSSLEKGDAASYPTFYLKAQCGSVIQGDFATHSYQADLRMDQLGSEALFGVAVGTKLSDCWRLELNARQRTGMRYQSFNESVSSFSFNVGYLDSRTLTVGAFYELGRLERAAPYIGLGAGIARNTLRNSTSLNNIEFGLSVPLGKARKDNFAYFLSCGTEIDLYKRLKLDLNYSFFHLGTAVTASASSGEMAKLENTRLHEVCIGLIYEI